MSDALRARADGGNSLSRRTFLAAGAATAAVACLSGAGVAFGDEHAVNLRPPGAAGERDFEARCNRCGRCVQACPRDVVQPLPLSLDFMSVGTPALIYRNDYCDYCMKCVTVCPTGALREDAPSADNVGVAKVISDACVAWSWSGCTVCKDVCPVEGVIVMDEHGRPVVDEDRCDGCGLCEAKCPSSSLRAYDAAVADRAICVVPRASEAAAIPGAITSEQLAAGRNRAHANAAPSNHPSAKEAAHA